MITDLVHFVRPGETLSSIAKRFGTTVDALVKENHITNPNHIKVGQRLEVPNKVGKVEILFLDKQCMPISDLVYRLEYSGKTEDGVTGANGMAKPVITSAPNTAVSISVKKVEGGYKGIGHATSDMVDKFFTLISPKIKLTDRTEQHEGAADAAPATSKPTSTGPVSHKKPVSKERNNKGHPVARHVDPVADWFDEFTKEHANVPITDRDWLEVAQRLACEVPAIRAVGAQESGPFGSFITNYLRPRPSILFERHQFSKLTGQAYDSSHPHISSRQPYRARKAGESINNPDVYGSARIQYLKLQHAYQLNPSASLQACSWGKFQVMGFHYDTLGYSSVEAFVKAMCHSEKQHLLMLAKFIESKPRAGDALRNKEWARFALSYNGSGRVQGYASEIETHFNRISAKGKQKK